MAKTSKTVGDEFETAGASFENADDGILVDFSNVQAMSFDPLPKGVYNVIIENCEYSLSKSSGKPMWSLQLTVVDEEYENRKIFTILSFSEKALPGTKTAFAVIAPEYAEQPFSPKDPEVIAAIISKSVRVKVDISKGTDEYPEPRNNVKKWMSSEESDGFIG